MQQCFSFSEAKKKIQPLDRQEGLFGSTKRLAKKEDGGLQTWLSATSTFEKTFHVNERDGV